MRSVRVRDGETYASIVDQVTALGQEFPGYQIDVEWFAEGPMFTAKRKRWEPAGGLYSVTRPDLGSLRRDLATGSGRRALP
jgi:hypothetical protein